MIRIIQAFVSAVIISIGLMAAILLFQGDCNAKSAQTGTQGQNLAYKAPYSGQKARFYHYLEGKPWAEVAKKYMSEQANQEKSLKNEVFNLLGITQKEFEDYKTEFHGLYLGSQEKQYCQVSLRAKKAQCPHSPLIFDFLDKHEIDVSSIKIISTKDMGIAAATQSNLYIDDAAIVDIHQYCLTDLAQADILHEMQHVLHDDSFDIFVIKNLLMNPANGCSAKTDECKKLLSRFDKFRENRADILAGLVDPIYARVSADYYAKEVAQGLGNQPCDTHPTPATRYAYLDKLHTQMSSCIENLEL